MAGRYLNNFVRAMEALPAESVGSTRSRIARLLIHSYVRSFIGVYSGVRLGNIILNFIARIPVNDRTIIDAVPEVTPPITGISLKIDPMAPETNICFWCRSSSG